MDTLQMKNDFLNNSREYAYTTSNDSLTIFGKKNNDAVRIVDAFAYTMTSPIRWERKDWIYFGGSLVAK